MWGALCTTFILMLPQSGQAVHCSTDNYAGRIECRRASPVPSLVFGKDTPCSPPEIALPEGEKRWYKELRDVGRAKQWAGEGASTARCLGTYRKSSQVNTLEGEQP
jgi:hypothetical protein